MYLRTQFRLKLKAFQKTSFEKKKYIREMFYNYLICKIDYIRSPKCGFITFIH